MLGPFRCGRGNIALVSILKGYDARPRSAIIVSMSDATRPDTGHLDMSPRDQTPDMAMDNAVSIRDAAVMANVTEKTIRRWIKSGRLHAVKLRNQYRITVTDLEVVSTAGPEGDVQGFSPLSTQRLGTGQDSPRVDMSSGLDSGHGQVDTVDLAPLTDLIRDQNRRIEELSSAAAFWQIRARQAEEQLLQLQAGPVVTDTPPDTSSDAPGASLSHAVAPTRLVAWWRRFWES